MEIYSGNLNYNLDEEDVTKLFSVFGKVDKVTLIRDRETGKSRGFAFIDMPDEVQAQEAIDCLNRRLLGGRNLVVQEVNRGIADWSSTTRLHEMQTMSDDTYEDTLEVDTTTKSLLREKQVISGPAQHELTDDGYVRVRFGG